MRNKRAVFTKKWVITIAALVALALIVQIVYLYSSVQGRLGNELDQAAAKAKQSQHLKKVLNVTYYHGTTAYDVVEGVNKKGKKVYVWVPDKKGKTLVKPVNGGWNKARVKQYAESHLHPKRLISIRLGAEKNIPVWEITYIDQNGRYAFYYLRFNNGEWVKDIHL